ncbi:hypothetical protein DYR57_19855 [Escherichia coli]|nr:hypothetical protein [Escherichia coli O25]EFN8834105.1 hypothetical protein [Escherichia coli]EFN8952048.1 hypothetical protein [Escherichia coli]EFN9412939.1 hypothetical protein [Escherichia coli]EFO0818584.1 hypothetical protein [Escherichia coli]
MKTRPAGAMKGLDYLPLTLFPVNIMHDAWNSLTIDACRCLNHCMSSGIDSITPLRRQVAASLPDVSSG